MEDSRVYKYSYERYLKILSKLNGWLSLLQDISRNQSTNKTATPGAKILKIETKDK